MSEDNKHWKCEFLLKENTPIDLEEAVLTIKGLPEDEYELLLCDNEKAGVRDFNAGVSTEKIKRMI